MTMRLLICVAFVAAASCGNATVLSPESGISTLQQQYIETITDIQFGDMERVKINSDIVWPKVHIFMNEDCAAEYFDVTFKGANDGSGIGSFNAMTTCFVKKLPDEQAVILELSRQISAQQKYSEAYDIQKSDPDQQVWIGIRKKIFHANLIVNISSENVEENSENIDVLFKNKNCSINYVRDGEGFNVVSISFFAAINSLSVKGNSNLVIGSRAFSDCLLRGNLVASGLMSGISRGVDINRFKSYCRLRKSTLSGSHDYKYICGAEYDSLGKYLYALEAIKTQFSDTTTTFDRIQYKNYLKRYIDKLRLK